jgi:hypothetical protein
MLGLDLIDFKIYRWNILVEYLNKKMEINSSNKKYVSDVKSKHIGHLINQSYNLKIKL